VLLAGPSVTLSVWPATVIVPERVTVLVFRAAVKATVPFPLPDAPDVMTNQATLLIAVHEQPGAVVTPMVPVAPADVCVMALTVTP
jgi:hypothetical protein